MNPTARFNKNYDTATIEKSDKKEEKKERKEEEEIRNKKVNQSLKLYLNSNCFINSKRFLAESDINISCSNSKFLVT